MRVNTMQSVSHKKRSAEGRARPAPGDDVFRVPSWGSSLWLEGRGGGSHGDNMEPICEIDTPVHFWEVWDNAIAPLAVQVFDKGNRAVFTRGALCGFAIHEAGGKPVWECTGYGGHVRVQTKLPGAELALALALFVVPRAHPVTAICTGIRWLADRCEVWVRPGEGSVETVKKYLEQYLARAGIEAECAGRPPATKLDDSD